MAIDPLNPLGMLRPIQSFPPVNTGGSKAAVPAKAVSVPAQDTLAPARAPSLINTMNIGRDVAQSGAMALPSADAKALGTQVAAQRALSRFQFNVEDPSQFALKV